MTDPHTASLPWPGPLAVPAWLHANLGRPGLTVLDVRSGDGTFAAGHVPGAAHTDYSKAGWRTTIEGAPGMLPATEGLARRIGELGIDNETLVVLIPAGETASDFANAARIYWTFKVLGHDRVSILMGGFKAWSSDPERPIEVGSGSMPLPRRFVPRFRPALRATAREVAAALGRRDVALVDARSDAHFRGEAKSPAARVPGTLPGAVQLNAETLFPAGSLQVSKGSLPEPSDAIITFCNTGHSASLAWFALSELAGYEGVKLYDGSMSHWTQDPSRPVVAGAKN